MSAAELAERIAMLRQLRASTVTIPTHFPAVTYLQIVAKVQTTCYINYCEGARVLYNWLTSDGTAQLTVPKDLGYASNLPKVSPLQGNYYIFELAKIVASKGDREVLPSLESYSYYTRLITYLLREIL